MFMDTQKCQKIDVAKQRMYRMQTEHIQTSFLLLFEANDFPTDLSQSVINERTIKLGKKNEQTKLANKEKILPTDCTSLLISDQFATDTIVC